MKQVLRLIFFNLDQPAGSKPGSTQLNEFLGVREEEIPPAALICTSGPTCLAKSATSSKVAPPVEKPVDVLIKLRADLGDKLAHFYFLIFCQKTSFNDHF